QVFLNRHRRGRALQRILKDPADVRGPPVLAPVGHVHAVQDDAALIGQMPPGDEVEQRRLAGAVAADDGNELPRLHRQAHVVHGHFSAAAAHGKPLGQIFHRQHGHQVLSRSVPKTGPPCGATTVGPAPVPASGVRAAAAAPAATGGVRAAAAVPAATGVVRGAAEARAAAGARRLVKPSLMAGADSAKMTMAAVTMRRSVGAKPARRAKKMARRYTTEPSSAPRVPRGTVDGRSKALPTMTDARPTTIMPRPMPTSA